MLQPLYSLCLTKTHFKGCAANFVIDIRCYGLMKKTTTYTCRHRNACISMADARAWKCVHTLCLSLTERANPRENIHASNWTEPLNGEPFFERNSYGGIAELTLFCSIFPSWNSRRLKCRAASAYAAYGKRPVVLHLKRSMRLYEQNQCSRWNDLILCERNFGQWLCIWNTTKISSWIERRI